MPELPKVDLVLTDPPWGERQLYVDAARLSFAVCKDNSFGVYYSSSNYINDTLSIFTLVGWKYFWTFCAWQPYNNYRYFATKVVQKWRPIIAFYKGDNKPKSGWKHDGYMTTRDKRFHEWGQDPKPSSALIRTMVQPDGIVLDPFLGGGTTLASAIDLGIHAIGIEIEERYCEIAANRCRQMVLPLEIPKQEAKQEVLI